MIRTMLALALLVAIPATAAATPTGTYTYEVNHSDYGRIGTYTNTIRAQGDAIVVDTRFEVRVGIGPIAFYREEADRREEWRGGRLVSYHSKTVRNGKDRVVEGRAEGDRFVVESRGDVERAPAGVWPMNPWSPDIAKADTVLASATGNVYPARVTDSGTDTILSAGREISARRYSVVANDKTYEIWFDDEGRLARFTAPDKGDVVTFVLTGAR